jgi:hypothetical protein
LEKAKDRLKGQILAIETQKEKPEQQKKQIVYWADQVIPCVIDQKIFMENRTLIEIKKHITECHNISAEDYELVLKIGWKFFKARRTTLLLAEGKGVRYDQTIQNYSEDESSAKPWKTLLSLKSFVQVLSMCRVWAIQPLQNYNTGKCWKEDQTKTAIIANVIQKVHTKHTKVGENNEL